MLYLLRNNILPFLHPQEAKTLTLPGNGDSVDKTGTTSPFLSKCQIKSSMLGNCGQEIMAFNHPFVW